MEIKPVKTKNGFSLIELIVVIGLLSLLMLAISSTMLMSIVSSNRIRTTSAIKNAGNYALTQMQGMLRNSRSITTCDSNNATITFVNQDGGSTTLFAQTVGTETRIASNSGSYLTPNNAAITSFSLLCEPDDTNPALIKISFDLKDSVSTKREVENPSIHFETSVSLRNE